MPIIIGEGIVDRTDDILPSNQEIIDAKADTSPKEKQDEYLIRAPAFRGAGNFRLLQKNEGLRPGEDAGLNTIRLETEFSHDKLWIDPAITKFVPYAKIFNQFELFQHNRRKRSEIIKEITSINELEFFMDSTGILVCKLSLIHI